MDEAVKAKVEKLFNRQQPTEEDQTQLAGNPNGIQSISPRLRGTSYLGKESQETPTPTGLCPW